MASSESFGGLSRRSIAQWHDVMLHTVDRTQMLLGPKLSVMLRAGQCEELLGVLCRGVSRADGKEVAIKQITCLRSETEQDVRRELRALQAVVDNRLPACVRCCGAYAGLMSPEGGIVYHFAMPCASEPPTASDSSVMQLAAQVNAMQRPAGSQAFPPPLTRWSSASAGLGGD